MKSQKFVVSLKKDQPPDLWKPGEMARFLGVGRDGLLHASPIKLVSQCYFFIRLKSFSSLTQNKVKEPVSRLDWYFSLWNDCV